MVGCRFSLACLILAFCVIKVRCGTAGRNHCGSKIPCDDSQCIDRESWCDVFTDCTDESDEKYCDKKSRYSLFSVDNKCDAERHFTCKNKMCIPRVLECDGHSDCDDGSDEKECDSSEIGGAVGPSSTSGFDKPIDPSFSYNNNKAGAAPLSPTDVPSRPSTPGLIHHAYTPTEDYYDVRRAEGGSTSPRYNSPTDTASAYPAIDPPRPSLDPVSISTPGPWTRGEHSFDNFNWNPVGATPLPPSQEPCDTTTPDPVPPYLAPWSPFNFLTGQAGWIRNQYSYNARRAQQWLLAHRDTRGIWGEDTPRALVALALSSDDSKNLAEDDILQRRLRIALGAKLIKLRKDRRTFRTSVLALYINAFVATCQDPRNVFEMRDLVEMLYRKVQRERSLDASPFPYLTLCLVGSQLTKDDRNFLLDIARRDVTDETSKDKFILATSALACLKKSGQRDLELDRSVEDAFHKLQQLQLKDGSFGSVYSTALAAQAMIAVDSESWDPTSTYSYLSSQQRPDGSFGDFLATYYALPALNGKSLLHLRNIQCQTGPDDPPKTPEPSTTTTTTEITTTPQPIKTVRYRLATEKPYETLAHLDLVVPRGDNFFDIMKKAAAEDKRFRFLHVEHDGKIDVYQISDIPNDPEFGLFWILYEVKKDHDRKLQRYTQDIRNLIPKHSDELIFRYEQFKPGNQ